MHLFVCLFFKRVFLLWYVKAVDGDTFNILNLFLLFFSPSVLARTKENIAACHWSLLFYRQFLEDTYAPGLRPQLFPKSYGKIKGKFLKSLNSTAQT